LRADLLIERPAIRVVPPSPPTRFLRGKRILDVTIASVVLVLGLPVFLVICLAVKLTSKGPALYSCERIGRYGRPFRCFKFRTMVVDADEALHRMLRSSAALMAEFERDFKLRRDPRVTPIGRVLRRISLDELPQFWNVLTGDMSVVGWRPIVADEIPRYGDAFPFVSSLRPGITGLWQVSGRNDVTYDERVRLDIEYRTRPALRSDVSIVFRTVTQLLRWWDNGAY
jgi:lipopolysaccharide/colanic/teichoic acid biosynthesis glycosyltransferase